ncbi:hypothetical protein RP20_CCG008037 [Aedes albopictus]|nr:hypothetical protein RP20_CCG008037 [Aedes albopictus]
MNRRRGNPSTPHKQTIIRNTQQQQHINIQSPPNNAQSRCGGGLSTSRGLIAILGRTKSNRFWTKLLADCVVTPLEEPVSLQTTVGQRPTVRSPCK